MKQAQKITFAIALLIMTGTAMGQRNRQRPDSMAVYREFAHIGQWYQQLPVHVDLHLIYKADAAAVDSTSTQMTIYYGKNDFYLRGEGMEQIANDSLLVLVNNETKMIKLYLNDKTIQDNLQSSFLMFASQGTAAMVQRYTGVISDEPQGRRRIVLQSRDKIYGTGFSKEMIDVIYHEGSYEPSQFNQVKRSLVAIDSSRYHRLANDPAYKERLVVTNAKGQPLFFMVREQQTTCRFDKVGHEWQLSPVRQQDRIVQLSDGTYQPAKGFENYSLSREF